MPVRAFGEASAPGGPSVRVCPDDLVDLGHEACSGLVILLAGGQEAVIVDRYLKFGPGAAVRDPAFVRVEDPVQTGDDHGSGR